MNKVILDTNFILSCIRNKIDFFEEIKFMGLDIIIPKQVILEIERITKSKKKLRFREEAQIALKLLKENKFRKIDLKRKNVDKAIIQYAEKNTNLVIATLDKEIKNKTKNLKLVIRGKKKLEVI
ncbi:MAG: hypothetical protein KKF68_00925 [Nanoarchaeota archaeon]|nr:hypothetical protein [Nanoarchaeota archaeon]